ncbi:MAG TPA: twin-arginine translocase TatA/TatE family subunit [Acidimicrobiales bacterium]|nr:twin-arginine translocase TatA/TatE family subunit [Acidimicrobiales bacterium]
MNLGAPELLILLVVVLLLFGATRLPKLARSMGEASREFKKGVAEGSSGEEPQTAAKPEEKVTMTKAELDAMLAEREAQARKDAPPAT